MNTQTTKDPDLLKAEAAEEAARAELKKATDDFQAARLAWQSAEADFLAAQKNTTKVLQRLVDLKKKRLSKEG